MKLFSLTPRHGRSSASSTPLQVRAQEFLANIQAAPQAPFPVLPAPQGPRVSLAAPAHGAAAENADAGNQNPAIQNPGLPEPPLEVNFSFVSSCSLSLLPLRIFLALLEVLFCMYLAKASRARVMLARPFKMFRHSSASA